MKHYWLVKWPYVDNPKMATLRRAHAATAHGACIEAFGMAVPEMRVKDLGTRLPRTAKQLCGYGIKWKPA